MRAVTTSGQQIDVAGRMRLDDADLRRHRDLAMARLRRAGYSLEEVAKLYKITPRYVKMRLARLPEWSRERAEAI